MKTATPEFRPQFTNLVQLLQTTTESFAERPLFGILQGGTWVWVSYREFRKLVDDFRAGLASLGVEPGDGVAVISNNRVEWAVGAHATFGLRAVYVPMYEAQQDQDWQHILEDSGAKVCLVANSAVRARIEALAPSLPALKHIVTLDGDASDPGSYAGLVAHGAQHPVPVAMPDDSAIASLIYTSGTTGKPKGVELSHFNLAANVSGLLEVASISGQDRGLAFLPWAHVFGGCVELNLTLATGGSAAICGEPLKLAEYLPQVKPTVLFAVPRVWNRIYAGVQQQMLSKPRAIQWIFNTAMRSRNKQRAGQSLTASETFALKVAQKIVFPKIRAAFGGQLRYACSGAAALPREVGEFMDNIGIEVYEGYGMTESGGCTTSNPRGQARFGSVGVPLPGLRIEIDKSVPGLTEDEGEVIIHGTGVMLGYHNRKDATRDTLTPDGGLRTGDLGRLDQDGYLYITGRTKELYKLENGKYVAPVPLEEKIQLSPYILQCVVYGSNRLHNVALIVPDLAALGTWANAHAIHKQGEELVNDPQVRALLESEVDSYSKDFKGFEKIQDFVIETEVLGIENGMLTPTLKLKRQKVDAKYGPIFESLYPRAASDRPEPRASYIRELQPAQPAAAKAAQR